MSKLIHLKTFSDGRGTLGSLEALQNVPFEIKRVYYLYDLKKEHPRGFHAHIKLKQLVVCLHGSCDFILDDGSGQEKITLSNPAQGLIIESMIWREMHNFTNDCVLMVLASEHYDEGDYIRDYETFKKGFKK